MFSHIFIILSWLFIAILNSRKFDSKSIIIWLATIVIIMRQIQIIYYLG